MVSGYLDYYFFSFVSKIAKRYHSTIDIVYEKKEFFYLSHSNRPSSLPFEVVVVGGDRRTTKRGLRRPTCEMSVLPEVLDANDTLLFSMPRISFLNSVESEA